MSRRVLLALGETLRLGGPENLDLEEVVAIFEQAAGRPVRRTYIPGFVIRPLRLVARLLARYSVTLTPLQEFASERARELGV